VKHTFDSMSRKDNNFKADDESSDNSENENSESKESTSSEEAREEEAKEETKEEGKSEQKEEAPKYDFKPREPDEKPVHKKTGRSGKHVPHFVMFAGIFIIGIIIGALAIPSAPPVSTTGGLIASDTSISLGADIGADAAAAKAVDFIGSRLEQQYPGIEVVAEGVTSSQDIPGTYEVNIKMTFQGQPQTAPYHVTKDGKWMFGGLIDLNEELPEPTQPDQPAQPPSTGVPKSDQPTVDLFIMSYCPYGLQAQKAMLPVIELLGDSADINVKWVSYIMHGKKEIDENNVQYCIQKEEPEKYVSFAECFTQSDDSAGCRAEVGIDEAKLDACIAAMDEEFGITALYEDQSTWSGGRYPQYPVDAAENAQFGVQGSPTLIINGQKANVARAPEAYKQAICDAFNTPPVECTGELPTGQATPGFGGDFESGVGAAVAAQCG
jgi:protein-disulfide isomerase